MQEKNCDILQLIYSECLCRLSQEVGLLQRNLRGMRE
jgi:hypothetical protein